ncbi:MAG: DNA recombination protein RmuC [Bacteroidales bacterium]|nr:DNA recombination protein RmuC [Bacteroidales bacterium]
MELVTIIAISALVAALLTWLLTYFIVRGRYTRQLFAKDTKLAEADAALRAERSMRGHEAELYAKSLEELKASHRQALEATKTELALENEKMLKAREESLRKEAENTMKALTGGLDKDIRDMKDAFEAQKKTHTEEASSIKTQFEQTVRHLKEQTDAIGTQAGDLASALKGQNKMQGIFGETILENLLQAEGLRPGRDYETEFWLRDKNGKIIQNELTDKKMRPDFALHYPDRTDVILDAKVSLTALSDYFSADTDEQRRDASRRNLQSVLSHVRELADKEYQKYLVGRKTLDYVIMFIPNYGAWQLARQEDPDIFTRALSQNVLITTEETLLPFLRLIRSAWVQKEQMENMSDIVAGAQKMLDRVALFCEKNTEVETSLRQTLRKMEENTKRLVDGRQSIAKAAQEVLDCGVSPSPGRSLPEPED